MPRWVRLFLGGLCIFLGVVGSVLPILQGWIFFLLGILILSRDIPFFARIVKELRARFPHTTRAAEKTGRRISRTGIRMYLKDKLGRYTVTAHLSAPGLSRRKSIAGLIGWLLLCYAAAWAGSFASPNEWYEHLKKPAFTPPGWVFGVVWTILYGLMAVAAWLVWKRRGFSGARVALVLFLCQLGLNVAWPWLFFGAQNPGLAFADILTLWFVLMLTLGSFWLASPVAGALLFPYFLWVSYAVVLNFAIWRMNL